MKKGFEINTTDSFGRKIEPTLVIGEFAGYSAGTVLDANAVIKLVMDLIKGLTPGGGDVLPNTVGTEQIINNSIKIEDLSGEVTDKLTSDYDSDEETLYPNGIVPV